MRQLILFCPYCDEFVETSLEYYPTYFEVGNFEKIEVIAGHVFCNKCGFELHDDNLWYEGSKSARIAYETLNKNR